MAGNQPRKNDQTKENYHHIDGFFTFVGEIGRNSETTQHNSDNP